MDVLNDTELEKFAVLELVDVDVIDGGEEEPISVLDASNLRNEAVVTVVELEVGHIVKLLVERDHLNNGVSVAVVEVGGAAHEQRGGVEAHLRAQDYPDYVRPAYISRTRL